MEDRDVLNTQKYPLLSYDQTIRLLSNPKASDVRASGDLIEHQRLMSLIYDSIHRLTEANKDRVESCYPTDREVYDEIQMRKRAISDRTPMPEPQGLMRICLMMAEMYPPLLYILREYVSLDGKLQFITRFVASTPLESEKRVSSGLHYVIHNSTVTIKTYLVGTDFNRPLQEKISVFSRIEDLPEIIRLGRLDQMLSSIYLRKTDIQAADDKDVLRLQKLNHFFREHILRPILIELGKNKITQKVGLDPYRKATGRVLPDVILFNNLNSIRFRLKMIVDLLVTMPVLKAVEPLLPEGFSVLAEKTDKEKISQIVAEKVIEAAKNHPDLPDAIVEICAERMALAEYLKELEHQSQEESDREEMKKLLQLLKRQKGIVRAKHGNRLIVNERLLGVLARRLFPGVLVATEPPAPAGAKNPAQKVSVKDFQSVYLLLKDRETTAGAIEQAEELFKNTKDIALIRLLEQMTGIHEKSEAELKEFIAPAYLDRFKELVAKSYLPQLPFLQRLWFKLNSSLPDEQTQRKLWKNYLDRSTPKTTQKKFREPKVSASTNDSPRQNKLDDRMQNVLDRISDIVTGRWEKGQFPDRRAIMAALPSQEDRAVAETLFGFIRSSAASTREIIEIPIPKREAIYASRKYLMSNLASLRERFERRMVDFEGHETKTGVKISMQHRTEERELVRAILQTLNSIGE
jgi:hypothetical protein